MYKQMLYSHTTFPVLHEVGRLKGNSVAKGHPALAPLSLEYLHPSKVQVEQESLCVLGAYSSNRRSLALKVEQPQIGKKN